MFCMIKIVKNITWIFGANLTASITKWLVLILIAKILTPIEVGIYSLAFSLTAPITIFLNLKLRQLVVTDRNVNFSDYLLIRILMSTCALIIIVLVSAIFYLDYFLIIVLVGLNKIFDLHSDLYYSIPHINNKFSYIGKLMIIRHLLQLLFFIMAIYFSRNLFLSLCILVCIQVVFYYFFEKKLIEKRFSVVFNKVNFKNVKKIIFIGISLGFSAMMVSLSSNIPRYLIEYFYSPKLLGYFSAIAYIVTVGNLLMNSVTQNFLNRMTYLLNINNIRKFKFYVFGYLTIFSLALGIAVIMFSYKFGETFLKITYGIEYVNYADILILMSFAVAIDFISASYDTALMSMRYISIQPKISIYVLIISSLLGILLVKNFGIYGAAYTIIFANLFQLILRFIFVIYGLRTRFIYY